MLPLSNTPWKGKSADFFFRLGSRWAWGASSGGHQGLPVAVEALDAALADDANYQEARGQFRDAVQALLALEPEGERRRLVLALEEMANHLVVVAVEVGWKVGVTAGCRKVV